jgi:hypothetical protein
MPLRVVLFAALALLCGCFAGGAQPRVTSDYAAQVKRVGVISLLGSNPHVSHLAASALESHFGSLRIADWDIDRLAYALLVPRLERKGYQVSILPRTGDLAQAQATDWLEAQSASVSEAVYTAGAAAGLDLIIVIQPAIATDFVTRTNQKIRGYGLQQAFDGQAFVYATIQATAHDIARRVTVGRATAQQAVPAAAGIWQPDFMLIRGERALEGDAATVLQAQLEAVLTATIGSAVQEAGL